MKIYSYNVNGIRSALQKGFFEWVKQSDANVICIQETKAQPHQIPSHLFTEAGYFSYWFSAEKKGYSGVGILTKIKPDNVCYGMGIDKYDVEGRVIRVDIGDLSILNVYHPSGTMGEVRQTFKMQWLEDFLEYTRELRKTKSNLIISGDFNICHKPIDIHDPIRNANTSGFLPEEREWMSKFINDGFIDSFRYFNKEPHNYTWWSFRAGARARNLGWRIDYNMVAQHLEKKMKNAAIYPNVFYSDHCPISLEITI
ncbi:MAG TPA: exodeoxyribonuclease III [Bacteroidales bacterium]|nr:exodeoxyribonuclease III [Bacteroidales bacterium]